MAYLIPAAAAAAFLGFAWNGSGKAFRSFALGLATFAAIIGREPFVVVYAGFLFTTLLTGLATRSEGATKSAFFAFAASDIALGLALTAVHTSTLGWTMPRVGAWDDGVFLLALAALARLWAGRDLTKRSAGMVSLGWWQGLYLAGLVGVSGGRIMAVGGLVLWLIVTVDKRVSPFTIAGGSAAIFAGLQGGAPFALVSIGLGGAALALGRTYGLWTSLALPLSAATSTGAFLTGPIMALPIAALPFVWLGAARRVSSRLQARGWVLPVLIAGSTIAAAPRIAIWLLFGVTAAYVVTRWLTSATLPPPLPRSISRNDAASSLPGWILLGCAITLWGRLMLIGVSTGFL